MFSGDIKETNGMKWVEYIYPNKLNLLISMENRILPEKKIVSKLINTHCGFLLLQPAKLDQMPQIQEF